MTMNIFKKEIRLPRLYSAAFLKNHITQSRTILSVERLNFAPPASDTNKFWRGIGYRFRVTWKVFTGEYDVISWESGR